MGLQFATHGYTYCPSHSCTSRMIGVNLLLCPNLWALRAFQAVRRGFCKDRPKGPGETEAAVDEVSAVAFSPSGDTLAGFTADGTTLKVWPLVAAWTQRLQRSSPVVLPSKVVGTPSCCHLS